MKNKVKITDLLEFKFIENLQYNPSGTMLAYQLARSDEKKNVYRRDVWVIENDTPRQLTATLDATIIGWYDDETLLLRRSTEDTAAYTTDVYKMSVHGGEAVKFVTLPIALGALKKVDDTTFVASATIDMHEPDVYKMSEEDRKKYADAQKEEKENYQVVDEVPYWFNGQHFINGNRTALFVIKTDPLKVTRVTAPAFDLGEFIVEGKKVIYTGDVRKARESLFNKVYSYDVDTKKKDTLYGKSGYTFSNPFYMNGKLYIQATDHKEYGVNETLKMCELEKDTVKELFKPEVSLYSSLAGDMALGGGKGHAPFHDHYYTIATEDYETVIYDYDGDFTKKTVKPEGYAINCFDVAEDKIAFVGSTWNHIQEVYVMDKDGKNITCLSHHNDEAMEYKYIAKPNKFTYVSEGETLNGWVLEPIDYTPKKKYPAVFDIHGGPRAAYGESFFHEMQVWASEGYFVFFTNIRGSDGRGDKFADIRGLYGDVDYKNLMDFADEVLKRYPAIDKDRVCETGGSYGGFMTNWIVGHTDRFCCAASQRSIANWISKSFMSDIGPYFNPDQCGASSPFEFDKLWDHSPLKYAENAKTPTLFIHSDQDHRCPLPEGMQMMQALTLKGVETRMCIFHGETHELSRSGKPKHRIRRLTEITNWFNKFAK